MDLKPIGTVTFSWDVFHLRLRLTRSLTLTLSTRSLSLAWGSRPEGKLESLLIAAHHAPNPGPPVRIVGAANRAIYAAAYRTPIG